MGKILIVDDSDFDRLMIARALNKNIEDLVLFEFSNGQDALDQIIEVLPDLIVLDVRMPGMDGFEVLLSIRRNPDFKDRSVVMLSGSADAKDMKMAEECGANAYYVKPSNIQAYYDIAQEIQSQYLQS